MRRTEGTQAKEAAVTLQLSEIEELPSKSALDVPHIGEMESEGGEEQRESLSRKASREKVHEVPLPNVGGFRPPEFVARFV